MEINGTLIKYEDNKIWRFGKRTWNSKEETWYVLEGYFHTNQLGYKSEMYKTGVNENGIFEFDIIS